MKHRSCLVSNSSSSSFVIRKNKITNEQLEQIRNYQDEAYKLGEYDKVTPSEWEREHNIVSGKFGCIDDYWQIRETEDEISAETFIDNFDFEAFLREIGVKDEDITWGEVY